MLDRQDIILLIASGSRSEFPLDPIRVMKGCFIVSQLGRPLWREQFDFRPYDYGPFDASVYRARDALLAEGLLVADQDGRYPSYSLTERGRERVGVLRSEQGEESVEWLNRVGAY